MTPVLAPAEEVQRDPGAQFWTPSRSFALAAFVAGVICHHLFWSAGL